MMPNCSFHNMPIIWWLSTKCSLKKNCTPLFVAWSINTYLNRDLLQLGLNASPKVIRNLWIMMAHLNGQLLNATTIGNSLGVTTPTVKRYIDFLEDAFLLKSLHPFHWNISKRLVKTPRVFLTDTGILHHLLGVNDFVSLSGNPIIGSSWESFVFYQLLFYFITHPKSLSAKLTSKTKGDINTSKYHQVLV